MIQNDKVQSNIVFEYLEDSDKRITVMQGGTRSGKTYNIVLWFIVKLLREKGKTLSIVRNSLPSLKGSVMRDFFDLLLKLNLYSEDNHHKTESTYILNGNLVEFVSVDQPQKIRGRKRNYLFINEANELNYEAWMQLAFRTEEKVVLDYNPSDEYHWIYDHVIPRDDSDFRVTTYRDNPFLPKDLVEEIERLKDVDENYWKVYGLGERGSSSETIFTHWQSVKEMPGKGEVWYGQDFGYNVQSALVKVEYYEGAIYCDEVLYETKLTTNDLVERYKSLGITRSTEIFCDAAEPKTIEELNRAGFNAKGADKDVTEGIRKLKSIPLYITDSSVNLIKEIKNYKWKVDKSGKVLDEPVKFNDHATDALRYAVFTRLSKKRMTWVAM
jgi:phage terminase large subunit